VDKMVLVVNTNVVRKIVKVVKMIEAVKMIVVR
jgi:hypothetical protein